MLRLFRQWRNETSLRRGLAYGIFFLCAYTAWARAGVYPSLQWPMAILTILFCTSLMMLPQEQRREIGFRVVRDPVFYAGAIFLFLIFLQWVNSGYGGGADVSELTVTARIPPKWFPWSVERANSAEMLLWFFPALVVLLAVRNVLSRPDVKVLLHLLVWNSAALACVGILQRLVHLDKVLGIWQVNRSDFFAAFDYPNHAAAWFYLHAALAAGLAYDAESKRKPRIRVAVWCACFLCCVAASILTLSRVGAFVALVQLAAVFTTLLFRTRKYSKGVKAFNSYLGMGIIVLVGTTLFFGAGGGGLAKEITGKSMVGEGSVAGDLSGRTEFISTAWKIFGDYPLFGCGGWGCDGVAKGYASEEELQSWRVDGRLNVHCDPVQFLTEFGVIGGFCIGIVVLQLFKGMIIARRSMLFYWVVGGLFAVLTHSLIDLPFRCPAILLAWCCLFASIPHLTQTQPLVRRENQAKKQ